MVTSHYHHFACSVSIHTLTDDFGTLQDLPSVSAWANAYRFANVVSFEQAGMRSHDQAVSEH